MANVTLQTAEIIGKMLAQIPGAKIDWKTQKNCETLQVIDSNDCCYEIKVYQPKKD